MKIAVAGGTGTVGVRVVQAAIAAGFDVTVLSRARGVDLVNGHGLDLTGMDAVVDVTSLRTTSGKESVQFFGAVTKQLLTAEAAAGVGHHLALSIVGIDRAPVGLYAGKVVQERLVSTGAVPWTILRATHFHDFAAQLHEQVTRGPLMVVPRMRTQPVAAVEVAQRLIELIGVGPSGRVRDLGGPEEERLAVRAHDHTTGRATRILEVPIPGKLGRAMRNSTLIPTDADHGITSYADWLR